MAQPASQQWQAKKDMAQAKSLCLGQLQSNESDHESKLELAQAKQNVLRAETEAWNNRTRFLKSRLINTALDEAYIALHAGDITKDDKNSLGMRLRKEVDGLLDSLPLQTEIVMAIKQSALGHVRALMPSETSDIDLGQPDAQNVDVDLGGLDISHTGDSAVEEPVPAVAQVVSTPKPRKFRELAWLAPPSPVSMSVEELARCRPLAENVPGIPWVTFVFPFVANNTKAGSVRCKGDHGARFAPRKDGDFYCQMDGLAFSEPLDGEKHKNFAEPIKDWPIHGEAPPRSAPGGHYWLTNLHFAAKKLGLPENSEMLPWPTVESLRGAKYVSIIRYTRSLTGSEPEERLDLVQSVIDAIGGNPFSEYYAGVWQGLGSKSAIFVDDLEQLLGKQSPGTHVFTAGLGIDGWCTLQDGYDMLEKKTPLGVRVTFFWRLPAWLDILVLGRVSRRAPGQKESWVFADLKHLAQAARCEEAAPGYAKFWLKILYVLNFTKGRKNTRPKDEQVQPDGFHALTATRTDKRDRKPPEHGLTVYDWPKVEQMVAARMLRNDEKVVVVKLGCCLLLKRCGHCEWCEASPEAPCTVDSYHT